MAYFRLEKAFPVTPRRRPDPAEEEVEDEDESLPFLRSALSLEDFLTQFRSSAVGISDLRVFSNDGC